MATTQAQGSNTYVPTLQENLAISFSRNESKFPLNQYCQIVPVDKDVGLYLRMDREEAGRITDSEGRGNIWADGNDRPTHNGELEGHEFLNYTTIRRNYGGRIGHKAVKQASFALKAKQSGVFAEKAMRMRTQLAVTQMTTTGNYDATHVQTVSSITGNLGNFEQSTTARSDIKRTLHGAAELIVKDTLNGIDPSDLIFVCSPGCARKMALSQEIVDYLKQSSVSEAVLRGEIKQSIYGLPNLLYGFKVVIEDTVKVTSKKGASTVARSYILPDTTPVLMSRVGALTDERLPTAASFSTLSLFSFEDMTIEENDDTKHRRWECDITDDFCAKLTAPISAVLFQGAVSA